MKNYEIDFEKKQITLSSSFAKLASNPANEAFSTLATIRQSYPDFPIVVKPKANANADRTTLETIEKVVMASGKQNLIKEYKELTEATTLNKKGIPVKKNGFFTIKKWYKENFSQ